jgi:integrase
VPAIADAMPGRYRAAVLLMASVGLRLGECCGLTVDRVDWLRHSIRIDRQMSTSSSGTGFTSPKTRAGRRTIPVPAEVIELLAAHLAEYPAGDDGLIFTHPDGGPVKRGRWADAYRIALAAAGAPTGTRTHDLRHVAASSLIAGGLSVAAVQAVLGHANPSETLDVYTHLWPTDEERTRTAIEASARAWL